MCLSCGCGQPNENHGNNDHITLADLEKAARASNISIEEAAGNIQEGAEESERQKDRRTTSRRE
jgi:hypothetical protein